MKRVLSLGNRISFVAMIIMSLLYLIANIKAPSIFFLAVTITWLVSDTMVSSIKGND